MNASGSQNLLNWSHLLPNIYYILFIINIKDTTPLTKYLAEHQMIYFASGRNKNHIKYLLILLTEHKKNNETEKYILICLCHCPCLGRDPPRTFFQSSLLNVYTSNNINHHHSSYLKV